MSSEDEYEPDPKNWNRRVRGDGVAVFSCKICQDPRERTANNCARHEGTKVHRDALGDPAEPQLGGLHSQAVNNGVVFEDALRSFLLSASNDFSQPLYPPNHPSLPTACDRAQRSPSPVTGIDWNILEALGEETSFEPSPMQEAFSRIAQASLDFLNSDLSDDELVERGSLSSNGTENDQISEEDRPDIGPSKRLKNYTSDPKTARQWFPWQDKLTCTLDILMHLPRSVFSEKQLDLFLWLLRFNDVDNIPSVKTMKALNETLQKSCGIDTIGYDGVLGNNASTNLYCFTGDGPEDSGPVLAEARQADRWLNEIRSEDTTPMIRIHKDDYYIFEPTMLVNGSFCVPHRWFKRRDILYAKAWGLEVVSTTDKVGWRVRQDQEIEVSERQQLKNMPTLARDHEMYQLPHPSQILDVRTKEEPDVSKPWDLTDPAEGNRWRKRAKGHRVMLLPLWMYCDDTSGNTSKKWNKHNSFLFTLAGLPREHSSKEYNIHFLSTSNLAPPLEMLNGIISQLETAQDEGIWAWDCVLNEPVLIFPVILALLGDNPMQSEFACHIGLKDKYFCPASAGPTKPKKRNKAVETMTEMVHRVKAFLQVGRLRHKAESQRKLRSYFTSARTTTSSAKQPQLLQVLFYRQAGRKYAVQ
ncbi:hypothetical protein CVT26_015365 [Gymnopilus dilepis]|uniref:Uncharacterized protein n=1 Tax=Gymnopilus dilepis TaxID=231916 RepID=A0A409WCY1_9AGAR|nr:hypothetical protein CVT26_015365 [Gymnopilus dilepis]